LKDESQMYPHKGCRTSKGPCKRKVSFSGYGAISPFNVEVKVSRYGISHTMMEHNLGLRLKARDYDALIPP
jgi:hypothetical protein